MVLKTAILTAEMSLFFALALSNALLALSNSDKHFALL